MDAANDTKYADGKKIDGRERRYYMIKIMAAVRQLSTATRSDWGTLDKGTHVLPAEYCYMVYGPGGPTRWYVTGLPPRRVDVPTHLLLLVNLDVQLAVLGAVSTALQRTACARGAIVLAAADHFRALEVLKTR